MGSLVSIFFEVFVDDMPYILDGDDIMNSLVLFMMLNAAFELANGASCIAGEAAAELDNFFVVKSAVGCFSSIIHRESHVNFFIY